MSFANPKIEGGRLGIEPIRSLLFSLISGTYFGITTAPLLNSARVVCFTNLTNSNLFVAVTSGDTPASDGTADQLIVPSNGFKLIDISTNKLLTAQLALPASTRLWARTATGSANPTSGFIYAEVFYGY